MFFDLSTFRDTTLVSLTLGAEFLSKVQLRRTTPASIVATAPPLCANESEGSRLKYSLEEIVQSGKFYVLESYYSKTVLCPGTMDSAW